MKTKAILILENSMNDFLEDISENGFQTSWHSDQLAENMAKAARAVYDAAEEHHRWTHEQSLEPFS